MLDLGGAKMSAKTAAKPAGAAAVTDATDASFMADVVEASRTQPVIVDFWAPWCGPCKQLTPVLEKVVAASKGAVRLVKVNIDENPGVAGQLRVQSIPTVYAFVDGQPVDGFQGALPESQVQDFIDRLAGPPEASDLDTLLEMAAESLKLGDMGGAAQGFAQALQMDPTNVKAIAGLARCYLQGGDVERAKEVVAMAQPGANDAELTAVKAAIALAETSGGGEDAALQRRVAADPADLQARFDLAGALAAKGDFGGAADQLLAIIAADRTWKDGVAKTQLLSRVRGGGAGVGGRAGGAAQAVLAAVRVTPMDATSLETAQLPGVIPVFPLDSVLLPPRGLLPLNIFEPRYLNMIDDAMAAERIIGMVQTRAGGDRERPGLAGVGGAGRITSFCGDAGWTLPDHPDRRLPVQIGA